MLDAEDEDIAETEGDSDEEWSSTVEAEFTARSSQPLWVLPLYSLLPSHKQARVSSEIRLFNLVKRCTRESNRLKHC